MRSAVGPTDRITRSTARQYVRQFLVTAALAATLVVSVATSLSSVAAAPVPPGGDSFQRFCKGLQDQANQLVDEYGTASPERARQIIGELQNVGSNWKLTGCQGVWGDIVGIILVEPPAPQSDQNALAGNNEEVVMTNDSTGVIVHGGGEAVAGGDQEVLAP
ncbi:MAG: hypothetical protein M3464_03535 [Chloroflexota bacterium]|nr:hypothetical protein [Chloroflexota bacterium]